MPRRLPELSRRERQIVDAIYRRKRASVREIMADLPDAPSNSAMRTTLQILVRKGVLAFTRQGRTYLYHPVIPAAEARTTAIRQLLSTYFDGSAEKAVTALLRTDHRGLSPQQYTRLRRLIETARRTEN